MALYRSGSTLLVTGDGKLASSVAVCPCPIAADVEIVVSAIVQCAGELCDWDTSPNYIYTDFVVFLDAVLDGVDQCWLEDRAHNGSWECWFVYEKDGPNKGKITTFEIARENPDDGYCVAFRWDNTTGENPIINPLVIGDCGDNKGSGIVDGYGGQAAWSY